jgi:hypothetical protein
MIFVLWEYNRLIVGCHDRSCEFRAENMNNLVEMAVFGTYQLTRDDY